jgi:hypothetical protein
VERSIFGSRHLRQDALGDVDAFIEQYEEETRRVPKIAAEIAQRLLATGRAQEAWQTIEATKHR